ncbi:putative transposable element [Trichonephila clavipes]|nr:putative transposable element [Trichonephila clavipes]
MGTYPEEYTAWIKLAPEVKEFAYLMQELNKVEVSCKKEDLEEIDFFMETDDLVESMSWIPKYVTKIAESLKKKGELISSSQDPKEIVPFIQDARVFASYLQKYANMVAFCLHKNGQEIASCYSKLTAVHKDDKQSDSKRHKYATEIVNSLKVAIKIACYILEGSYQITCGIEDDAKKIASYLQKNDKQIASYLQEDATQIASYVQDYVKGKESSKMNLSDVLNDVLDAVLFATNLKNALENRKKNISSAQDIKESVSSIQDAETSPFLPKEDAKTSQVFPKEDTETKVFYSKEDAETSVFFPKENILTIPNLNNLSPCENSASVYNTTRQTHVPIVQGDENILNCDENRKRIDGKYEMYPCTREKEADAYRYLCSNFFPLVLNFMGMILLLLIFGTSLRAAKTREVFLDNVIGLLHADSVENGDLVKMYATANMFGSAGLIKKSSALFQTNLTVSNVWIARSLADANEDLDLKKAVEEFLLENSSETIGNATWREVNRKVDYRKNRLRSLLNGEAHFWLNGYVNKQNCRIWSEANPQVYVETLLHPEKLTVWCALWAGGIIGPYFLKNDEGHNVTVSGAVVPTRRRNMSHSSIDLLKDTFGDRLISRFGPVKWPPRSCDLTPLDYFLWGYVKSLVYADKPQTLDHLEDNLRRVIADIRPQMLEKVNRNMDVQIGLHPSQSYARNHI